MNDWYANGGHDYYCSRCQKGFDRSDAGSWSCPDCGRDGRSRQQRKREEAQDKEAGLRNPVTYVPRSALASLRQHGLLSGKALLSNPEALVSAAAGRGESPEEFRAAVEKVVNGDRPHSSLGPNVMFAPPPEQLNLGNNHPLKKWDLQPVRVRLTRLLRDMAGTRVHGQELVPFKEEEWERLGDDYADVRHRDLKPEEIQRLRRRSASNLWKNFQPTERGMYAPDVPHAAVITPDGRIDPKYLQFPKEASQDHILVSGHSGAGKTTLASRLAEALGRPLVSVDDHPEVKPFFRADPENKHLVPRTPEHAAFLRLKRKASRETLQGLTEPSVVEGTQLSGLPSKELLTYPQRVHVTTPLETLLQQRFERVLRKAEAKGKPIDPDSEEGKRRFQVGRDLVNSNRLPLYRYGRLPGTHEFATRSSDFDALVASLNNKQAGLLDDVKLQEHQQRIYDGASRGPVRKLLNWGLGSGKCVRGNTILPTDIGLVAIESLFSADAPEGWSEAPTARVVSWRDNSYRFIKVRRKYKEKLPDEVATVKVTTSRGNWLEGTTEHPFLTVRGGLLAWVPAGELQVGDLVAMASRVPAAQTPAEQFTPELAELLAWQVAEGHERPDTPSLTISQHDRTVLERLQTLFRQVVPSSDSGHIHDRKKALCIWSVDYCRLLQTIGYAWGKKSAGKALPQCAFSASHSTVVTVLRSLFDAEGNAEPACISFTSASSSLIDQVQYLLLQLGVRSAQHYAMKCATNGSRIYRPYGRLTISGYDLEEYSRSVGFSYAHKQAKLVAAAGKKRNPNCGVPAGFALDRLRQLGLLKSCGVGTVATTTVSYHLADRLCTGIRALTTDTGLVRYREILAGKRRAGPLARKQCANVVAAVEQYRDELARLEHAVQKMRDYDLRFEAVASVERGQFGGYVYDIEVDCDDYDDKNYVAGSGAFVVHNSLGSLAAAEAYGQPYTAIVPAALRPTYLAERKKFTDGSVPAQVMSYTELARGKPVQYPDSLVFDEAHRLRSPGSAAAQRAQELAQKARQVVMLSGTPTVNSPGDMAPLVSMLASKKLDPEGFEERYVRQRKVQPGFLDQLRGVPAGEESVVNHEDELKALLQGHVDYYSPEKPVVPVTQEDHVVEMGPEQTQLYRAMWDQLPFYLRWKLQNQFPLSRQELLRLRSFLSGPRQVGLSTLPYLKDKDPRTAFQQSTKLQKALSLMQESLKDERVKGLVFSNFIDAGLRPYASALEDAGVPHGLFHGGLNDKERKKLVDDYNAGKIRVALIGPSGTEGLSFKGTQVLQQLDEHFHPVRSRQAKGRGLRYDSHWGLPDDLQNLRVQRFVSRLPPSLVNRVLAKVWLGSAEPTPAVDDHLRNLSDRKEKLNSKFLDLLREVGTPSPGESVR